MKNITVIVELTDNNYSAYIELLPGCVSTGNTFEELQLNMHEAVELHLETNREYGDSIPDALQGTYKLKFKFHAESLLQHYRGIFTNSALERLTGINQRQLQRYASGESKPRPEQAKKISKAFNRLGKELQIIDL